MILQHSQLPSCELLICQSKEIPILIKQCTEATKCKHMIHEACVAGSLFGEMEEKTQKHTFLPHFSHSFTAHTLIFLYKDFAWNQVANCMWNAEAHWGSKLPPGVLRTIKFIVLNTNTNTIVGAKTLSPFSLRVYWFEPLNPLEIQL